MDKFIDAFVGKVPGANISVEKQSEGPPTGKPINIEISGKEFNTLVFLTDTIINIIEKTKHRRNRRS